MNSSENEKKSLAKNTSEETSYLTYNDKKKEKNEALGRENPSCSFSDHTSNPNFVLGYN